MGVRLSPEVAAQASTIAVWLFVAAAPVSLAAIAQWVRAYKDDGDRAPKRLLLGKLLALIAVGLIAAAMILLALSRRSQMDCCYYT